MSKGGMRWGAGRPSHKLRDCDTRAIDVRRWQREGLLKSQHFGWQWTDSDTGEVRSSISVYPQAHGLSLSYAISGQPYRPFIATTTTPCHFLAARGSGSICPGCSARCARLLRWGGSAAAPATRSPTAASVRTRLADCGSHKQRSKPAWGKTSPPEVHAACDL